MRVLLGAAGVAAAAAVLELGATPAGPDNVGTAVAAHAAGPPAGGMRLAGLPALAPGDIGARGAAAAAGRPGIPVRLRIPALGLDTPLDRVHRRPDGTLPAPVAWGVPAWFADGPRPGEIGPAVVIGHVDSTSGPAVFFGLRRLRPGDAVEVTASGGAVERFAVVSSEQVPKRRFPTAAVYGPQPVPVLRLITCTGDFDRAAGSYLDNLVVTAYATGP